MVIIYSEIVCFLVIEHSELKKNIHHAIAGKSHDSPIKLVFRLHDVSILSALRWPRRGTHVAGGPIAVGTPGHLRSPLLQIARQAAGLGRTKVAQDKDGHLTKAKSYGTWTIDIEDLPIINGDVLIAMLVITRGYVSSDGGNTPQKMEVKVA